MACGEMQGLGEKCQEINACWKNKSRDVLRRSLEYQCFVTSLSPSEDLLGLGVLGPLESVPVVTLTLCVWFFVFPGWPRI